jgi:ArsR family transcriptional regulator
MEDDLAEIAATMKVLSDPNRLQVFAKLLEGDSCNCELKEKLGLRSSLLSHHLGILKQAGLVNSRRDAVDGRWIYYAADRAALSRLHRWFGRFFDPARVQKRQVLCGPEGSRTPDGELVRVKIG